MTFTCIGVTFDQCYLYIDLSNEVGYFVHLWWLTTQHHFAYMYRSFLLALKTLHSGGRNNKDDFREHLQFRSQLCNSDVTNVDGFVHLGHQLEKG